MTDLKTKRKFATLFAFALVFTVAASSAQSNDAAAVRIGLVRFMGEAPSFVALQNGLFEAAGLKVTVQLNPAGRVSLKNLFDGKADIVTVADTPLVYKGFERDDFRMFAVMTHTDSIAGAVARRDRGIAEPAGIKGKRVGLFQGTASDYLLDRYLLTHILSRDDLIIVDLKPKALVLAIVAGEIDAMFSWEPHVLNAASALGGNAYRLPTKGMKILDWIAVTTKEYAARNADTLERYLRAIDSAIRFINADPRKARAIVAASSGIAEATVDALWDQFSYGLTLGESMLLNLEDQARWHSRTRLRLNGKIPNYLDLVEPAPLRRVRPDSVTIVK